MLVNTFLNNYAIRTDVSYVISPLFIPTDTLRLFTKNLNKLDEEKPIKLKKIITKCSNLKTTIIFNGTDIENIINELSNNIKFEIKNIEKKKFVNNHGMLKLYKDKIEILTTSNNYIIDLKNVRYIEIVFIDLIKNKELIVKQNTYEVKLWVLKWM